jgi:hypothetical protein
MKKQLLAAAVALLAGSAFAGQAYNLISFPLAAQTWVKSKTALVSISVNATVKSDQVGKLHGSIVSDLNKIAKTDWHVTRFNRMQDSSGLEKVSAVAQARLPINDLGGLTAAAKRVSKAGEMFKVQNLTFSPSFNAMQSAQTHLRFEIYNQAKAEMIELNKVFPHKHYSVYSITFNGVGNTPKPVPMMATAFVRTSGGSNSLATSDKLTSTAIVTLTCHGGHHHSKKSKHEKS